MQWVALGVLLAVSSWGCSAADGPPSAANTGGIGGADASGMGAQTSSSGGLYTVPPNSPDDAGESCGQSRSAAVFEVRPIDVILVIANNPNNYDTVVAIEQNLNENFADILAASGADYRVIVLSQHGPSDRGQVCISGNLNPNHSCVNLHYDADANLNPPRFYHYSHYVYNIDAFCVMLDTYASPEDSDAAYIDPPLSVDGWKNWLRPEAHKVIVLFSDDGPRCTTKSGQTFDDGISLTQAPETAAAFDVALTSMAPLQFGTPDDRKYTFHSFLDIVENVPAAAPYTPDQPLLWDECHGQFTPGLGYQALSRLTGGLRTPICIGQDFDEAFRIIASGVIAKEAVSCDFPLTAPAGEIIDRSTVEVVYTDGSKVEHHYREAPGNSCVDFPDGFYFDGDRIRLCPVACEQAQADPMAQIEVRYGCELPPVR